MITQKRPASAGQARPITGQKSWHEANPALKKVWRQDNNLKIIPLGGCEEVGRNMTCFEYGQDIVILDMGLQFPEEDMPGIDYVIPNVEYLKGKEKNIRGVIFSHGHLDHI
jgi:mRNA degradation ribonuclease J1/J2